MRFLRHHLVPILVLLAGFLAAREAPAFDFFDERLQVHGYLETQFRSLSDGFREDRWFVSQWAQVLTLEIDADIAPDGIGPFDSITAYIRAQARFDCIWSQVCGTMRSATLFGDRSNRAPRNLANGVATNTTGVLQVPGMPTPVRTQDPNGNLVTIEKVPPISTLIGLGATRTLETFAPAAAALYTTKEYRGTLGDLGFAMGPWQPKTNINAIATLAQVPDPMVAFLPLRPQIPNDPSLGLGQAHNLYVPSTALRERINNFDSFDQNFSQEDLQWNRGASQEQTKELKEAYLDIEMLEGRLFVRLGKQTIVWGKTELFPIVDQFNPYDFALTNLPSLEESRIPLWSARAIYSFYDVGPLEDVRLELATNLDRYQPSDIGKCGEPYAAWLVCGKTFGLQIHGLIGVGLAGEQRPPDFWENVRGLEFGGRVEWRWERFSFALTDFYGYSDFPFVDKFNEYSRKVDPTTGRPLAVDGTQLLGNPNVLAQHPANRQLFDAFCSATGGLAAGLIPALGSECFLELLNSSKVIATALGQPVTVPIALGAALAGTPLGKLVLIGVLSNPGPPPSPKIVNHLITNIHELNKNEGDGPFSPYDDTIPPVFQASALTTYLTQEQQALLGCGPFYGTSCDMQGIDLFNAEASVLLQSFPQFEPGGPVATRYFNGQLITLPGARTIYDPSWTSAIDGCPGPAAAINAARAAQGLGPIPAGACTGPGVTQNLLQFGLSSELQAVSTSFLNIIAAFGTRTDPGCDVTNPITCTFVRGIFQAAGVQRPEAIAGGNGRYGRRDFVWSSGGEASIKYRHRNVLGLSTDFAEDTTKTNWGVELTWTNGDVFENTMETRGFSFSDAYNITISVDRPTIINFVNPGRTILFNMQWFFGFIPGYEGQGKFSMNGPFMQLGTFTAQTGYFQDRLLPSITLVHDVGSNSGAILPQITYRFSESFSTTIGVSTFYGKPQYGRLPLRQLGLQNNGGDFMERFRFQGLSPIAERDEVFAILRYTF
ncbi:MAG: hypothetical protein IT386_06520 [Deltaproteobacteria bacterium]|nr:hypothetical protein [Deltaproteobacteria bacterium]